MANPHGKFQASQKPFDSEPEGEELKNLLEKLTSKCEEDSEDETPNLLPSNTPSSTQKRRKRQSKVRRSQKRQRRAQEEGVGVGHIHRTFLSQKEIASLPTREMKLKIRLKDLPFGNRCYVGSPYKESHGSAKDAKYYLENGYEEIQWDGQEDVLLLDADDYVIGVLAGCPASKAWPGVIQGAEEVLQQAWTWANDTQVQSVLEKCKARGTHAITTGFAYGGGRTEPRNKAHKPNEQDIADALMQNDNIERIANFQSNALGKYAPKIWKTFHTEFNKFYERYDGFKRPFKRSVYPQLTFNLGGRTVSLLHRDSRNTAAGLCPITSLGSYSYKKGGHAVLPDLRVIIQFPPGTTILIPSALLIHGNTTISPDETRLSITSYSSGGLLRWIQGGFRSGRWVDRQAKGGAEREAMLDELWGNHEVRLAAMLDMFSQKDSLVADRKKYLCEKLIF